MSQIVDAVVGTVTRFVDAHGPKVVVGAVVVVGVGIVLKVLHRLVAGRGPDQN